MPIYITLIAIAVPTFIYAGLVHRIDRFEKEPTRYLVFAFLWGAIPAIILALILELVAGMPVESFLGQSIAGQFAQTAVVAPVVEECMKALAVAILYLWRKREFDGWVDGIVYGSTVGFGFAFVENIFYIADTKTTEEWFYLYFLRVLVFGFMHGFWTSLTGIGFGVARNSHMPTLKWLAPLMGLAAAIFFHTLHNGALVFAESTSSATLCLSLVGYGALFTLLIGLSIVAARHDRAMFKTYLLDEVPDVVSPEDYAALCNTQKNVQAQFRVAGAQRRQFIQLCAKLAQKKKQLLKFGLEGGVAKDIDLLRQELLRTRL